MNDFLWDVLNTFSKTDLIDLIIEASDNDFLPIELIMLRSDYEYTPEQLASLWEDVYNKAAAMEGQGDSRGAYLLSICAQLCFDQALRFTDETDRKEFLCSIVSDLQRAAEEDGIGMREDSEWQYGDVANKIKEYLEK